MALSIKDPVTGQYNWPLIIGGGGIVVVGGLLLLNRGSSSNTGTQVSSPGQSSDITGALGALQQAIAGLNPGGGGGGSGGSGGSGGGQVAQLPSWWPKTPSGDYWPAQQTDLGLIPKPIPVSGGGSVVPSIPLEAVKNKMAYTPSGQYMSLGDWAAYQQATTNPNQPGAVSPTPGAAALNEVIAPSTTSKVSNVSESVGTTPRQNPTSPVGGNYTGRIQNAPTKLVGPTGPPYRTA